MTKAESIKALAAEQGVSENCIYSRINRNWTWFEICMGHREGQEARTKIPKDDTYDDYHNGNTAFLVLLYDVIRSINPILDAMELYILTISVFMGLLDRQYR